MEQGRLFLAIIISLVIFIGWDYFFVEKQEVNQRPVEKKLEDHVEKEELKAPEKMVMAEREATTGGLESETNGPMRNVSVETQLFKIIISEKGATFKSVILKKHRVAAKEDSERLEMIAPENQEGTVLLGFESSPLNDINGKKFTLQNEQVAIDAKEHEKEVRFKCQTKEGFVIEKIFLFLPDQYVIGQQVKIYNGSEKPINENMFLSLRKYLPEQKRMYGFEGPSALVNNKLKQVKLSKIEENPNLQGEIKWITLQNRYFMASLLPENPIQTGIKIQKSEKEIINITYLQPTDMIRPGETRAFRYNLYFGPKKLKTLKKVGNELEKAVHFGMFDILAKPCLWIMNFIYGIIPNYGLSIIFLTLIIKILLWPLGTKSYKSMAEMKKVQPIMMEIREKYKNDKKKMNEEIMGLYRTYKINPLGGCLPMIVQIPVFFALYRMLYEAIELRHAPFFGWIKDLSAPDRLFDFGISIPFMEPPVGIPVLTIIMGATMFLQQKMSPPVGDPAQAKMMMMMPIVFTVIFVNFSSGLVLYWLINNIFSISQQYLTQKSYK